MTERIVFLVLGFAAGAPAGWMVAHGHPWWGLAWFVGGYAVVFAASELELRWASR